MHSILEHFVEHMSCNLDSNGIFIDNSEIEQVVNRVVINKLSTVVDHFLNLNGQWITIQDKNVLGPYHPPTA